jgi:hypothetical protein
MAISPTWLLLEGRQARDQVLQNNIRHAGVVLQDGTQFRAQTARPATLHAATAG